MFLAQSASLALGRLCESLVVRSPEPGARLVRVLRVGRLDGRPEPTPGTLYGAGLDARRFADLSSIDTAPVTPTEAFFVRTTAPPALDAAAPIVIRGGSRASLTPDALRQSSHDQGVHLIECAGNTDPANFGLMSVARWNGVPLMDVLADAGLDRAPAIAVTGADPDGPTRSSVAGASWILTRDQIERTGAFLATGMNGGPLPANHGHPVRLTVPGWYGCASIKWVTRIEAVGEDAPLTSQMREFASRTHQQGLPALAREYDPPVIDVAATPIRVEHWDGPTGSHFRVVGIVWGGPVPARSLEVRFSHREPFVPVTDYQRPQTTATWSVWSHVWRPREPGRYQIVLRADSSVRTRRLDAFFYLREVELP